MSKSEKAAIAGLRELGLMDTEARIYVALLRGSSDAKKLSQASGVPYSKIHTVLSRLVQGSMVTELRGRPTIYEARRAAEGLAEYRRRAEEALDRKIKAAEEALNEMESALASEKPDIWIIRNQEEILKKSYQALGSAKSEAKFALPVAPEWAVLALVPVLTRLRSMEVKTKLLLTKSSAEGLPKASDMAEVKIRDKMFGGGIIVDEREALLFIGEGAPIGLAIWSNHSGLVQLASTYFDYLWSGEQNQEGS